MRLKQVPIPAVAAKDGNPLTDQFKRYVLDVLEEWHLPGLSLSVVDGDKTYSQGYGVASVSESEPENAFKAETLSFAGSCTKAMTCALLAHMIDTKDYPQLANGWNTTLHSIIPDDFVLQDDWATLNTTLDDAACHRSGMAAHDIVMFPLTVDGRRSTTRDAVRNMRNVPMTTLLPRTTFHYCNVMYIALSHVIEVLTGKPLGDALKEMLWQPLGMNSTYFDTDDALASGKDLSESYVWDGKQSAFVKRPPFHASAATGAGAVISTANDFAKWMRFLIHEEEPFFKQAHKDLWRAGVIVSDVRTARSGPATYGRGWGISDVQGVTVRTHSGGTQTHTCFVLIAPEIKFGVTVFCNQFGNESSAEYLPVRRLLEDKLGIPQDKRPNLWQAIKDEMKQALQDKRKEPEKIFPDTPKVPVPARAPIDVLAGSYTHPGYGKLDLRVKPDPDDKTKLVMHTDMTNSAFPGEVHLRHVSADFWLWKWTPVDNRLEAMCTYLKAWFEFGIDGQPTTLTVQMVGRDVPEGNIVYKRCK